MAERPASFRDVVHLRTCLASAEVHACVDDFLRMPRWSLDEVVRRSVEGTTFRAFALGQYGASPALLYRTWLHWHLEAHLADFLHAQDAVAYQQALDDAVASLQRAWRDGTRGQADIGYGRAAKLLNLSLKHVLLLDGLDDARRGALRERLHVALDRFTLGPIAQLDRSLGLGRDPSMGAVKTRDAYLVIQRWIAHVCAAAGVPPIQYEFATFNFVKDGARPADVPSVTSRSTLGAGARMLARARTVTRVIERADARSGGEPHVDTQATVVRTRDVVDATVIHASAARHRGAVLAGTIEVADERTLSMLLAANGKGRFQGKLLWFGRPLRKKHPSIRLDGEWRVERGYSGPVVADIGRVDRRDPSLVVRS